MSSRQLPFLDVSAPALVQADRYPHLRYMGSKYRLLPTLASVFEEVGGKTALDPRVVLVLDHWGLIPRRR